MSQPGGRAAEDGASPARDGRGLLGRADPGPAPAVTAGLGGQPPEDLDVVDVHHHAVPRRVAQALGWRPGLTVDVVADGHKIVTLHDRVVDLERHLEEMDRAGVSCAVLSCFVAWDGDEALCREVNDDLARQRDRYPGRFDGLAVLPTADTGAAVAELRRAVDELGLPGISVMTLVDGRQLDDESLHPLWRAVEEAGVPVFVHPVMRADGHAGCGDFDLGRIIGREFDLVTAATRAVAAGTLGRFPGLELVFAHLGGGIAAIAERIEKKAFRFGAGACEPFAQCFRRLHFDMAGFEGGPRALACALGTIEPSRLVFGTDFPQDFSGVTTDTGVGPEAIRDYVRLVWSLDLGECERRAMLGGNWRRLSRARTGGAPGRPGTLTSAPRSW